jgi:hypothetical protein
MTEYRKSFSIPVPGSTQNFCKSGAYPYLYKSKPVPLLHSEALDMAQYLE